MALVKSITSEFGVPVTHWKAVGIRIDYKNMKAQSIYEGYASKACMDDHNSKPLMVDIVTVDLFWTAEKADYDKPAKPERLVTLEALETLTEDEQAEKEGLEASYNATLASWQEIRNKRVVMDATLQQIFGMLYAKQNEIHKLHDMLKDAEEIPDEQPNI